MHYEPKEHHLRVLYRFVFIAVGIVDNTASLSKNEMVERLITHYAKLAIAKRKEKNRRKRETYRQTAQEGDWLHTKKLTRTKANEKARFKIRSQCQIIGMLETDNPGIDEAGLLEKYHLYVQK